MRLFTAIALPGPLSEALGAAAAGLVPNRNSAPRIRWTAPANMHVTLSFLGSVEPARLNDVQQSLTRVHAAQFSLTLAGLGVFPHAGVLLAKVHPSPELLSLAEQVAVALEGAGFPREKHPYQPHVTLARTKERGLSFFSANDPTFHETFHADMFHLYESVTLPEGAQYRILHSYPLNATQ